MASVLADPYRLAGITGHLTLLKVFDKEKGEFVAHGDAIAPVNKFRAVFSFEDNKGKLHSLTGTLVGPEISPGLVAYKGESDDRKMSLEISFYLSQKDDLTKVKVEVATELRYGVLEKLFGASLGNVSEHLVAKHIVPYLKSIGPELDLSLSQVKKVTGSMSEIIEAIKDIHDIDLGLMIIKGDNFKFKALIHDKKIERTTLEIEGKRYYGEEALARLLTIGGKGELAVYEIPVEEFLWRKSERA